MMIHFIYIILTLLSARYQIFQEIYRDLIICWKIYASVDSKKVIALTLALVLRRKLLGCYLLQLRLVYLNLLIWVALHIA